MNLSKINKKAWQIRKAAADKYCCPVKEIVWGECFRAAKKEIEKIKRGRLLGTCGNVKSPVKNYRRSPGDFTCAANAAFYYAKKHKKRMLIVPGNSYGRSIFHITTEDDDIKKYTVLSGDFRMAIVNESGEVFEIIASA